MIVMLAVLFLGLIEVESLPHARDEEHTRWPSSTLLPLLVWGPLIKPNIKKKGTLIVKGLLGNLA